MEIIIKKFKENVLIRIICFFILFTLIFSTLGYLIYYCINNIVSNLLSDNVSTVYDEIKNIGTLNLISKFAIIKVFNISFFIIWKLTLHFTLKNFEDISNINILKYVKIIMFIVTVIIVIYLILALLNDINDIKYIESNLSNSYNGLQEFDQNADTSSLKQNLSIIEYAINTSKAYFFPMYIVILIDIILCSIITYFLIKRRYFIKYLD